MLLQFSTANFRSINQRVTLSMLANNSITDAPLDNYTDIGGIKVLKSAVIYGANSSGKSNLVNSLAVMRGILLNSIKLNDGEEIDYKPFLLRIEKDRPSFFELVFIVDGSKYRYGFETTNESVMGEWLFKSALKSKTEKVLFIRNTKGIGVEEKNFAEGVGKEEQTNGNRLFLSLCAQLGGDESKKVMSWFQGFNLLSGIESFQYQKFSIRMFHDNRDGCSKAKEFFQAIKLGFKGIETLEREIDAKNLPDNMPPGLKEMMKSRKQIKLLTQHNIYDQEGHIVHVEQFDVDEMESEGTKKLIQLSGPIFDTLEKGRTLVVDELDAKMHPLISQYIIRLFNDPKTNPNGAQLIFTTHDTNLLSSNLFRRDQIWFTEKDSTEQTDLYNMMDIKLPDGSKPRNDANYEKNYIAGRYGAVPYILYK